MWIHQWFTQLDAQLRKTTLRLFRRPITLLTFMLLCSMGVVFVWLPSLINTKEATDVNIMDKVECGFSDTDNNFHERDACVVLAYTPKTEFTDNVAARMQEKFGYSKSRFKSFSSIEAAAKAVLAKPGFTPFVANFGSGVVDYESTANIEIDLHANYTNNANTDSWSDTYSHESNNLLKIQHQLESSILEVLNSDGDVEPNLDIDIEFKSLPYVKNFKAIGNIFSLFIMPTALSIGVLMASMTAMYLVLDEKKENMLQMMRTMGLCESTYWLTWALGFTLLAAIGAIVPAVMAQFTGIRALTETHPFILYVIFATFYLAVVLFNISFVSFSKRVALIGMSSLIIFGLVMMILDIVNGIKLLMYLFGIGGHHFKSLYLTMLYSPNTAMIWRVVGRMAPIFGFGKIIANIVAVTTGTAGSLGGAAASGSGASHGSSMIGQKYDWNAFTSKIGPFVNDDKEWWGASDFDTCMLMLLECVGYMVFAWYMGQVQGGGHKRFFFPLNPRYWGFYSRSKSLMSGDTVGKVRASSKNSGSIRLLKMSKGFKGIQAVKELSIEMQHGKTFCLLGHNGAGKTTTINVLTGVHKPTFGHAFVLGHSVQDEIGSIQRLMGICPQHDILFEELSGADHIKFWARFKGMDRSKLKAEVERSLTSVSLFADAKQAAGKYSGGMQRRLSVAISTLGSPGVIFLDEPTTGMDPLTRRKVWGTINDLKKNAVVVLTTHSMEEADALGDNIAIMANGSLRAVGSSLFLKDKFGQGSQVNLITDMSNTGHIEKLAKDFVPASTLVSSSAGNMTFSIPNISRRRLPAFFEALEDPSNGISEWGISSTTLEEVFVRLTKANKSSSAEGDIEDDLDSEKKCKICEIRPVTRVQLMTGKGIGLWVDGVICQHCARTPEEVRADEEKEAIEYQEREKAKQEELKTLREAIVKEVNETFIVLQNTETAATADNTRQTPAVQTKIYELKKKIYDLQQQHGDYASVIAQQQQEFAQQQQQQQVKMIRQESIDTKQPLSEAGITVKVPTAVEEANMSKPQLSPQVVMVGSTETDEEENRKPTVVGTAANISVVPTASKQFKALTMKNMNLIKRQKKTMACFLYCACQIVTMLFLTAGVGSIVSVEGNYNHKCGSYKAQVECSKLATAFEQHGLGYAYIYGKNDGDFNWNMIWNTEFYTPSILDVDSRDLWYSQKAQSSDTLVKDLLFYDGFATPFVNFKNFDTVSSLKELSEPVRVGQETMNSREFKVNITEVDTVLESYFPLFAMYVDKLNTKGDNLEFDGKFNDYGPTDNKWYDFEVNFLDDKGKLMDDMIYWMGSTHSANTMRARMNMIQWVKYALLKTAAKATSKVVNMVKTNIYDFGDMIAFENYPSVAPTVCSGLILLGQFFIPHFVQQITMEKESKLISALRMQGMRMGSYHLSNYFFVQLLVMIPTFIVIVCMLLAKVKLGQSILYWIISVPCWAHSTSGLALTMPSFFRSSKIAVIVMFITVYMSANISSILIAVVKDFPWWVSYIPIFQGAKLIRDLLNKTTSTETIMSTLGNMLLSGTVLLLIGIVMENIALGIWKPHRFISHLKTKSKNRKERRVGSAKRQTTADTINNPTNDEITIQVQNKNDAEDEDVLEESIKADKATSKDNPIIVRHMKKNFGPKQAVKDVSFVGDQGQCFGLLGPNGAGKTTTLSMMSGTLSIGGGEAIISGFDVETELQKVYTVLGMSPQFDRLYEEMSVEEHLKVYSKIRGVNSKGVRLVVRGAAESVELDGDQFRMISSKLSGGMKRRLSIGMTLLGQPPIIFLDEPTTGLDPETRNGIWKTIERCKRDRCVVLVSHSMEEVDALCTRVGIMATGSMRCIGTPLHLKAKFGSGYQLKVNLAKGSSDIKLSDFLRSLCEASTIVYSFGDSRTYRIPAQISVAELFKVMDERMQDLNVKEWSISHTSLDEVFVNIVQD
eukprot:TRINITY_DN5_c0_g1_i1.p1 TRINITY_DN5_c0_g1~~TRINITY_DN5_c0_g1_i1.p1  ORF type:complete len:1937 (-),score=677.12 TRINITY_DN5_c0_g1_i1:220-6030(-)